MHTQTASAKAAQDRESLILDHLPQVRLIARRIHERLPGSVSLDDLISTGIVGLISAIDNFDPKLNVKLKRKENEIWKSYVVKATSKFLAKTVTTRIARKKIAMVLTIAFINVGSVRQLCVSVVIYYLNAEFAKNASVKVA